MSDTNTGRSVFVVHGRNWKARDAMFEFLRALDLHPIEWSEAIKATRTGTPHISAILDQAFSMAQAIVVLFTPDDEARLRPDFRSKKDPAYETQLTGQARPNVLFEAGLAMGRDSERTIMVEIGDLRPFSDISGRHIVRLDESSEKQHDLASRLEAAGCAVNRDGMDWLGTGRFDFVATVVLTNAGESAPSIGVAQTKAVELSKEARHLLTNATGNEEGLITIFVTTNGLDIGAGNKNFHVPRGRDQSIWEEALTELEENDLVKRRSERAWTVTRQGWTRSDELREDAVGRKS